MTTPKGHKNLWKEIDWKDDDRKLAFYNKYFKKTDIVAMDFKKRLNIILEDIIYFIETGMIIEKNVERKMTLNDVIKKIETKK